MLTTAERWQRHQRDLEAYRRRSLMRRSHARFRRDLDVVPHLFLRTERTRMAPLIAPAERVLDELKGRAVWTLDTAARITTGRGFLVARDLTGYLEPEILEALLAEGLAGAIETAGLSVDPVYRRPPMLIAHLPEEPVPFVELSSGQRVVPWELLVRDLMGTLGWRPDLLTRLEDAYPAELRRQAATPLR